LYCDLNHIPDLNRAPLLFILLDTQAFNAAQNLHLPGLDDYQQVALALLEKFDSPAGELGHQIRLNNRKQSPNETLSAYLDALTQIAKRTNLDQQTQHNKIIETMLDNAMDPQNKRKILKFMTTAQEQHWDQDQIWENFQQKIKTLE